MWKQHYIYRVATILIACVVLLIIAYVTMGDDTPPSDPATGAVQLVTVAILTNTHNGDALVWDFYQCKPQTGVLAPGESIQLQCGDAWGALRYVPLPITRPAGCPFDADGDGDVDTDDMLMFQACFNGPNRPPNC